MRPGNIPRAAGDRRHLPRALRRTLQVGDARQLQRTTVERTRSPHSPVLRPGCGKSAEETHTEEDTREAPREVKRVPLCSPVPPVLKGPKMTAPHVSPYRHCTGLT